MKTTKNDKLRDLIANQPGPEVSDDFVARTLAAARKIEQDPAEDQPVRGPWLKIVSLAAAAVILVAISLDALNPAPDAGSETNNAVAIEETEDIELAVLVANAQLPEERKDVQLMLILDDTEDISDEDLLAFAL